MRRLTRGDQAALAAWQTAQLGGLLEVVATLRRRVRCPACRGTGRGLSLAGTRITGSLRGPYARWMRRHRVSGQRLPRLGGPRVSSPCGVCENRWVRPGFISPDAARRLLHEVALLEGALTD